MTDIYFFGIYDLIVPKRTPVDQTAISWDRESGKLQVETNEKPPSAHILQITH